MSAPVWTWRPRAECGTLRLELGGEVVDLMDEAASGLIVTDVDIGGPEVREVVAALPTRDGSFDTTRLIGPRVVTITGNAVASALGSRQKALDNLHRYCTPRVRPVLTFSFDADTPPRVITLRASAWSAPTKIPDRTEFAVSWVAPDPVAYALDTQSVDIGPPAAFEGRRYDLTFDRTYPPAYGGSGVGYAVNAGNYQTWPILRIDGPVTDPDVLWVDPPAGAVVFTGLHVGAGHYLDVDTRAQTVYEDGDPAANRYSYLDFVATRWAPLEPGRTALRFRPDSFDAPSSLRVIWADAWL